MEGTFSFYVLVLLFRKNVCTIVIDYRRTHIINENLLRESDKLLLMCDRSSWVYPLCQCWGKMCPFKFINVFFSPFGLPNLGQRKRNKKKLGRRWVIRRQINRAMEHTSKEFEKIFQRMDPTFNDDSASYVREREGGRLMDEWYLWSPMTKEQEQWHEQRKTKNKCAQSTSQHSSLIK